MKLQEGNVFTPVCHSVDRGVSVQRRRGVYVQGVSVQGVLCPGGLCPTGVSVRGDLYQGGSFVRETPHTVMCGRYASYWNAFLYLKGAKYILSIKNLKPSVIQDCEDKQFLMLWTVLKIWNSLWKVSLLERSHKTDVLDLGKMPYVKE